MTMTTNHFFYDAVSNIMRFTKPLNQEIIMSHVEYLKGLESQGKLMLCGPLRIILEG